MIAIDKVRARFPGRRIEWLESCATTMTEAAALAAGGCSSGSLVGAEEQTAGRGRLGRKWHAERGAGLCASFVLRLNAPAASIPALSLALGLATAEAIARATDLACDLRWPNDVLIGGKKCAGILVEMAADAFIAGIGINVNHAAFPEEIAGIATSLRIASGREHPREQLLSHLIQSVSSFAKMLEEGGAAPVLAMFTRASSYVSGMRVQVDQGGKIIEGVTDGLDPSGFLYVRQANGERALILAGGVRPVQGE